MKQIVIAIAMLISMASQTHAQKFWNTTETFPNGAKTAITLGYDDALIVGTTKGIIRSTDKGATWTQTLADGYIHTLYTTKTGVLLAGSVGAVYVSEDNGLNWFVQSMLHPYPVRQFAENSAGQVYAVTGELNEQGYKGAGVFVSTDGGYNWTAKNTGLHNTLACFSIAIDKNDKLYLTMPDEHGNGAGGLFTSTNNGATWQHPSTNIDGKNAIAGTLYTTTPYAVTITPTDSVLFSFNGISRAPGQSGVGVDVNLVKHMADIDDNSLLWHMEYAKPIGPMWWNAAKLNRTHFAANGDMYSSISGSENSGGSTYKKDGNDYLFHGDGLGLDQWGRRGEQYFAEATSGRVYMVQFMDEQVYYTDKSVLPTGIGEPADFVCQLYPNPVRSGGNLSITLNVANNGTYVSLYDVNGREVLKAQNTLQITMPEQSGVYLLSVQCGESRQTSRVVVQ